jgi:phenylacetic acid degradation operon negative regulatory protein
MTQPLAQATRTLVARFQRQRPMRVGSLLITIFGDAVAPRGGTATLGSLIRLAQPFGIPERHVRTSVGRLAQEGWLAFHRSGRQSEYFLTDQGKTRFAEATERIYGEAPQSWDGQWTLVLLPGRKSALAKRKRGRGRESGPTRKDARDELRWLGFGEISPGMLAHPSRSVADTQEQLAAIGMDSSALILRAKVESGEDADRALLRAGWDLAELGRSYERFLSSFAPIPALLDARVATSSEQAFIIRTLLIHEYRKIHLRDPLLPASLLPADWVGTRAYDLCRTLYRKVFPSAEEYVTATAETLSGPLPPPASDTYRRFGGLGPANEG